MHNVTRDQFDAGNVVFAELVALVLASIHNQGAFESGDLPDAGQVVCDIVEILSNTHHGNHKDADRVDDVSVPKPKHHGENLEDVERIEHFTNEQLWNALLWHDDFARAVDLLEPSNLVLVEALGVESEDVLVRVLDGEQDWLEPLLPVVELELDKAEGEGVFFVSDGCIQRA